MKCGTVEDGVEDTLQLTKMPQSLYQITSVHTILWKYSMNMLVRKEEIAIRNLMEVTAAVTNGIILLT